MLSKGLEDTGKLVTEGAQAGAANAALLGQRFEAGHLEANRQLDYAMNYANERPRYSHGEN